MLVEKVGEVRFDNRILNVYGSLDEPLFKVSEIANVIEYGVHNARHLTWFCEEDEKMKLPMMVRNQTRHVLFVTELGLYNILSQSRVDTARKWRRIVHTQLIELRKSKDMNIEDQFEEWDSMLDDIYYDEETGMLMRSVTVPGGDVEQVPVNTEV